jgi:hypothetical protein
MEEIMTASSRERSDKKWASFVKEAQGMVMYAS